MWIQCCKRRLITKKTSDLTIGHLSSECSFLSVFWVDWLIAWLINWLAYWFVFLSGCITGIGSVLQFFWTSGYALQTSTGTVKGRFSVLIIKLRPGKMSLSINLLQLSIILEIFSIQKFSSVRCGCPRFSHHVLIPDSDPGHGLKSTNVSNYVQCFN